jgi:two-component system chemotaxis sensor kinase CheA
MDRAQLVKRLMATFLEELQEQVQALNRDLLALKKEPEGAERADRLKQLFRTAHSLKGAARSVNVRPIEDACHHLEEMLSGVRAGSRPTDADFFSLLLQSADAIEEAGRRLQEEKDLAGSPLTALLPRLAGAAMGGGREQGRGEPAEPGERVPTPRPSPPAALPPASPSEPAAPPPARETSSAGSATLRIAAEKLDALLASSGELLVVRRRVPMRAEELATLREAVSRWRTEWQAVEKPLAKLLRGEGNGQVQALPRRFSRAVGGVGDRLRQLEKDLERLSAALTGDSRVLDQVAGALDEDVRRVRMLPFAEGCQGLERIVHDLAQVGSKEVELVIEGGDVELDRSVLEGLKDPLRHLVRNAVDHGVEPAAERRAAGKPPRARVTIAAVLRGTQVEVIVADDGRGLDLEALRRRVRAARLPEPADDRELARLVFQAGLSTSERVTDVSGRGVGLDVVKSRVEALHGTVDLTFTPGGGTRFSLAVPLTLTMLRALLVVANGQTFAFVGTNVQKLLRVAPQEFRSVAGRQMLSLGGAPLPVVSLAETLGLLAAKASPSPQPLSPEGRGASILPPLSPRGRGAGGEEGSSNRAQGLRPLGARLPVLIVAAGAQQMAFVVDELLSEQEVVIKSLGSRLRRVPHVAGATLLPSGRIALVLNAANLVRTALANLRAPGHRPSAALAPTGPPARKRLLLVEDSLTTRTLEKTILKGAGYAVTVACDGAEAWQLLQERGADLIVSDLEMPRMDGFALTEAVRTSPRFRNLPVVLVTARENEQDKTRGIEVGANAYLVKSAFDQRELLETIAQLL